MMVMNRALGLPILQTRILGGELIWRLHTTLNTIQLIFPLGTNCRYIVEVSSDIKTWQQIAEGNKALPETKTQIFKGNLGNNIRSVRTSIYPRSRRALRSKNRRNTLFQINPNLKKTQMKQLIIYLQLFILSVASIPCNAQTNTSTPQFELYTSGNNMGRITSVG